MKLKISILLPIVAAIGLCVGTGSCDDNESYAERLDSERDATNAYLSGYKIVNGVPEDTVFVTVADVGEADAPFYRIEPEGNVYMQVVKAGDRDSMARTGDKIFFRYTCYNLSSLYSGYIEKYSNSENMAASSEYFYYNDFSKSASSEWGIGLQMPLQYVGINSEVNVVIKSQYGPEENMTSVNSYVWNLRYFKSAL